MATRFRLPSGTDDPIVAPSLQTYTHTGTAQLWNLPQTDASVLITSGQTADLSDHLVTGDKIHAQFVSAPMAAGIAFSTSDTVKYAVQGLETHAANNLFIQLFVSVVSQDGNTVRATLRSKVNDGTELTTSLQSRTASHNLTSDYTTEAGDRLVVEFSVQGTPTNSGGTQGHNASIRWGSNGAGGDLAENDSQTGLTLNPWIEFSPTITFGADEALSGQVITTAQGNVTPSDSSGQSFGSATGSLGLVFTPTSLGSQLISVGQGTVTASLSGGGALTIGLSGAQAEFFHTPGAVKSATALSGQASTTQTGTVVAAIAGPGGDELTGSVATFQVGTLVPNLEADDTLIASGISSVQYGLSKALTGIASTSSSGTVSASVGDRTVALVADQEVQPVFGAGTTVPGISQALIGLSSTLSQQTMSSPGRVDLSGQSSTMEQGFFGRAYSLSGQEISVADDFMDVSGFVPMVGDSSTGQLYTFEDLALPKTLPITGVSMSMEQGILTPVPSVEWIKKVDPNSMWTKPANPNSAWVKKDSPSSEWNKK
jgi:hypothetical protein